MLNHANHEAADDIDKQNEQTRDRIAPNKFGGTIHRSVKVCFSGHIGATNPGFFLGQNTRIHISINGHLLTGHRVQGKSRRYLGHPASTLGHDHKIDNDQDRKNHQTDRVITANHKFAKGFNHLASSIRTGMPFQQNNPG